MFSASIITGQVCVVKGFKRLSNSWTKTVIYSSIIEQYDYTCCKYLNCSGTFLFLSFFFCCFVVVVFEIHLTESLCASDNTWNQFAMQWSLNDWLSWIRTNLFQRMKITLSMQCHRVWHSGSLEMSARTGWCLNKYSRISVYFYISLSLSVSLSFFRFDGF